MRVGFSPVVHRFCNVALITSVIATLLALFIFGYIKGSFTGSRPFTSAFSENTGWRTGSWSRVSHCKGSIVKNAEPAPCDEICVCLRFQTAFVALICRYVQLDTLFNSIQLEFQISIFVSKNARYLGSSSINIPMPAPI